MAPFFYCDNSALNTVSESAEASVNKSLETYQIAARVLDPAIFAQMLALERCNPHGRITRTILDKTGAKPGKVRRAW